jgi:CheY-like chemotaxis protein
MKIKTTPEGQSGIPSDFGVLNLLIVDDEEFNLYLIKSILKKWGVTFSEAHNGLEALEEARKTAFDVILMDIRMPVMDGYEATKQILQFQPATKIIALTGTTKPEDIELIKLAGMHNYLRKPFTESELHGIILNLFPEKFAEVQPISYAENPMIDLDELKRITGGDPAFMNEMLSIFIRSGEDSVSRFQLSMELNDWSAIAETAHKLAAPAKHLQATSLYNHLKELENTAIKGNRAVNQKLILKISEEISQINSFLKQHLSN